MDGMDQCRQCGRIRPYRDLVEGRCRWTSDCIAHLWEKLNTVTLQRNQLMEAVRAAASSLSQSATYKIPPIVVRDVAERLHRLNQQLNLP